MSILKTKAGTELYFNDLGSGPPHVFTHGRPLSAAALDD